VGAVTGRHRADGPVPALTARVDALAEAVRLGGDVLAPGLVAAAEEVVARAGDRMRLPDHTVVALAGPTGSGKSSLLNALAGAPVARVAVTRPTTSEALALVRGEGAEPLLDWLAVRRRHDLGPGEGLVVLDLPDHDSVVTDHRTEAERLVGLVDLLVWVVDPQKYADAAVHERYLRRLSEHRDVLVVVLNQVDRLTDAERAAVHADLVRLLAEDGLAGVRVLDVSARTGAGVPDLQALLADAARRRVAARERLEADLAVVAGGVLEACGAGRGAGGAARTPLGSLVDALADAAGVPLVVEAVRGAHLARARRATGWPPTRWLGRLRPDPLRRLHLGRGAGTDRTVGTGADGAADDDAAPVAVRTSVPAPGAAQVARARTAVRAYVDAVTAGLPDAWVLAARRDAEPDLADELDAAVAGTRLPDAPPRWWRALGALQWLALGVALAGAAWLGALAVAAWLRLALPEPPAWGPLPAPTALLLGGVAAGLLLALLGRGLARLGARRRARLAEARLRERVADVARRRVVAPVERLTERLDAVRAAARAAAGR
jgi:energy-coupling factor transporter ATP-binding protein EcfA2